MNSYLYSFYLFVASVSITFKQRRLELCVSHSASMQRSNVKDKEEDKGGTYHCCETFREEIGL